MSCGGVKVSCIENRSVACAGCVKYGGGRFVCGCRRLMRAEREALIDVGGEVGGVLTGSGVRVVVVGPQRRRIWRVGAIRMLFICVDFPGPVLFLCWLGWGIGGIVRSGTEWLLEERVILGKLVKVIVIVIRL
jgi:hypothetical protein